MGKRLTKNQIEYSEEYEGWILWNTQRTDFFGPFETKQECEKVYKRFYKIKF